MPATIINNFQILVFFILYFQLVLFTAYKLFYESVFKSSRQGLINLRVCYVRSRHLRSLHKHYILSEIMQSAYKWVNTRNKQDILVTYTIILYLLILKYESTGDIWMTMLPGDTCQIYELKEQPCWLSTTCVN